MLFFYNGDSKTSCIYEIRNRSTNRSYIGQTMRPQERWVHGHRNSLLKGIHGNRFLQNDFNKCFEHLNNDNFLEFHIIQFMPKTTQEERNKAELFWIKKYKKEGYHLYNIIEEENGNYIFTEDTKKKMSEIKKLQWQDASYHQQMSDSHKGYVASEETKQKMSVSHKGLNTWSKGKTLSNKGKQRPNHTGIKSPRAKVYSNIKLQSPDNKIYTKVECAAEFARTHDLNIKNFNQMLNGKRKSHKGWKLL